MLLDIFSGHFFYGEIVFMILCMAGAWMIGKSVATDWNGLGSVLFFTLLLGIGARFLHFALYGAVFVSLNRYLVDTAVFLIVAYLGFRFTRTNQMTRQYHWLYEKASPISWKARS
ncbi:MAG: DUF6867 family protein [Rhizobiaceae bacterium]